MENAAVNRKYDEIHKDRPWHDGTFRTWSKERSDRFPYHARDGVTVWVASIDLDPDDEFLAQPLPPQPGQTA